MYVGQNVNNTIEVGSFNGDIKSDETGGPGGGATDIRTTYNTTWYNFNSLKSRIMVAAGGGDEGENTNGKNNAAGGLVGYAFQNTSGVNCPTAATQTAPGSGACWTAAKPQYTYLFSKFGIGYSSGAGGGGGYYGGGGGYFAHGGGAGGSSFISGHSGCNAISSSSTESNIVHTGQANHYSGYKFTNTVMIDDAGYKWTNVKGGLQAMPKPAGGTYTSGTGNFGNGYARIIYLGSNV